MTKAAERIIALAAAAYAGRAQPRIMDDELDVLIDDWATRKSYTELMRALARQKARIDRMEG